MSISEISISELTNMVFVKHIENILKNDPYPNQNENIQTFDFKKMLSFTIEQTIIRFLAKSHVIGDKCLMTTRTHRQVEVTLNEYTGSIFEMTKNFENVFAIYIGEVEHDETICSEKRTHSYFYVKGEPGLSYWEGVSFDNLQDQQNMNIHLLRNTSYPKVVFKNGNQREYKKELYNSLEYFNDVKMICSDGEIETSRLLLCLRSKYFLVYFMKYVKDNTGKIDFPKIILENYIVYLIQNELSVEILIEHLSNFLEFANFIGDIEFIQYIYERTWPKLDPKDKLELNHCMKSFFLVE